MLKYIILIGCLWWPWSLFAQTDTVADNKVLQEVVVTATRNEQLQKQIPIAVTVIKKEQLQSMGAMHLDQVLAEQTGLFITSNHGTGVQMQGLEAEYTLILLDGEPLIGRTAGTLDLSRIVVSNIERIEIVKGPVSSLYGSDAMAGVINIITSNKSKKGQTNATARYGSNNTWQLDAGTLIPYEKGSFSLNGNYFDTKGYTIGDAVNPSVFPYHAATGQTRWQHDWNHKWQTIIAGRYFDQRVSGYFDDGGKRVLDNTKESDANASLVLRFKPANQWTHQLRLYYSRYATNEKMEYKDDKRLYDASFFTQQYIKPEYQFDWVMNKTNILTAGAGYIHESLEATRYDERMSFNSGYLFVQENWRPTNAWNVLLGARFDTHNQYPSQISPKMSVSFKINDYLKVLGTVGRGYRAPDFRQLYLHFNNAAVGYSVVGTKLAAEIIRQMQAAGEIKSINYDLDKLSDLNAESSWSYNVGLQSSPGKYTHANVNFFLNRVSNLIDTRAVAQKTNDFSVYSYVNVNSITTYGAEVEINQAITKHWQVAGGYQYLMAIDNELLNKVKSDEVCTVDEHTHQTRVLTRREYFGLFNRSHHAANLKVRYTNPLRGLDANLRLLYRSKYGFVDENGNNVPDKKSEFALRYATVNLAVAKSFIDHRLRFQITADNILNYTDAAHIPTLPGRVYTAAFYLYISTYQIN
ncbi:outer membrane receptor for ferrienterochelin and colicins [Chitinophaga jiangningensis]|uniref:Outer membrane receptor for ferrienterochelin and colicins n=1 Tax=Chitinophaga jiangningensis TaxID=1419482 RepID=A0A1M7CTC2_9BACT|nr:TonB-dependent receptor [Chitinophaga jiangningensis]SHL70484.1 outer membrane receptor for ferrienterochelin and colicins [Chitinophaga jiangningensis]